MKRNEIIEVINSAGEYLDEIDEVRARNTETGEEFCVFTDSEKKAVQTALLCCARLLEGESDTNAMSFLAKLIKIHMIGRLMTEEAFDEFVKQQDSEGEAADD